MLTLVSQGVGDPGGTGREAEQEAALGSPFTGCQPGAQTVKRPPAMQETGV